MRTLAFIAAISLVLAAAPGLAHARPERGFGNQLYQDLTGRCLDVVDRRGDDGAPVQRWDCGLQSNRQWLFTDPAAGSWSIRPRSATDKCLDVKDGRRGTGTLVQIWACNSGGQQRWTVDRTSGTGREMLRAAFAPALCLGIDGNGDRNGGRAGVWACEAPTTLFYVTPAGI